MPLFGKSKSQKRDEAIAGLATAMGAFAHSVSLQIVDAEGTEDMLKKWNIHTEVLGFFCHYLSRRAFAEGGPDFRAELQDEVVPLVISSTLEVAWDSRQSNVENQDSREAGFKEELQRNINAIEAELSECQTLGMSESEMKAFSFTNPTTMIGALAARIDEIVGNETPVSTRMNVAFATTTGLALSKMSPSIKAIWSNH